MVDKEELMEKTMEKIKEAIEEGSDLLDGTLDKKLEKLVINNLCVKDKEELPSKGKERIEKIVKNLKSTGIHKLRSSDEYADFYGKGLDNYLRKRVSGYEEEKDLLTEETNQLETSPAAYLTAEEMNSFMDEIARASDTKTSYSLKRKLNEKEQETLYT